MPKVRINDISMYYEIQGTGEPIIFIGGFSVDQTMWKDIIDLFKSHYQVVLFDNRGAGQTDAPDGHYSIEQMADDVAGLCAKLSIRQAHVVGNSMGGFILQSLAWRYPSLVKSAIISNSVMAKQSCFHFYLAAQLELLRANAPLAALIKAVYSWVYSFQFLSQPGMFDQLVQLGLENPHPFTLAGYAGQLAALESFDSRKWIKQINVPTLVLGSDQDLIFSEASVKELANHIPDAQYYCFKECGHIPSIEYPELFVQLVKKFIATNQNSPALNG